MTEEARLVSGPERKDCVWLVVRGSSAVRMGIVRGDRVFVHHFDGREKMDDLRAFAVKLYEQISGKEYDPREPLCTGCLGVDVPGKFDRMELALIHAMRECEQTEKPMAEILLCGKCAYEVADFIRQMIGGIPEPCLHGNQVGHCPLCPK